MLGLLFTASPPPRTLNRMHAACILPSCLGRCPSRDPSGAQNCHELPHKPCLNSTNISFARPRPPSSIHTKPTVEPTFNPPLNLLCLIHPKPMVHRSPTLAPLPCLTHPERPNPMSDPSQTQPLFRRPERPKRPHMCSVGRK